MSRVTVEACARLDVRQLSRDGRLRHPWSSIWRWTNGVSAVLEMRDDAVWVAHSSDGEPLRYAVPVVWTRCNYGGSRPWFQCPEARCGRRCAVVYLLQRTFACRRCNGLAYRTQHEQPDGRLLIKAERLWARLGWGFGEEGEKPKGMQRRTFERIKEAADSAYLGSFHTGKMARLLARAHR